MGSETSPSYREMQQAIDYAVDRSIRAVTDLFKADLNGIGVEIRSIRERLDQQAKVTDEISALNDRMTAMEAFKSQHEHRLNDIEGEGKDRRRWRRDHVPGFVISLVALVMALVLGAHQLGAF